MGTSGTVGDITRAFHGRIAGSVRTDRVSRELYSTDASPYRIVPQAVLRAEHADDLAAAVEVCRGLGLPITPRGAGTSFTGQCVGAGLALDCAHLDAVEWIDAERRVARVQPGARWWELNRQAAVHGLTYGPDPATRRQCTVGGMTATNSGGTHSVVYGAAVDHVEAVDVVLADGATARLEATDGTIGGLPAPVAQALEEVRRRATPLLGPQYSTLARRGSGYQLEHLCTERPHMGRFFAGSEGTLGLLTAIEVTLDPLPTERVLALVAFEDLHAAMSVVPALVGSEPYAVEVVSRSMVDIARNDPFHARQVSGVDPEAGAFLFVEYHGFEPGEAEAGFERMEVALADVAGLRSAERFVDPRAQAAMWAIREAGIGALSAVAGGPNLPQAFVEDCVVAVDRLPPYIRAMDELFARHAMDVVWYGHASTGLVHVRPFLDLTDAKDLERLEGLMADTADLVRDWAGDFSGEHGDGLARTWWNERLLGPELYGELVAIKRAFDPHGLMNPGKVVDGQRTTDNLRFGTGYRRVEVASSIGFSDFGGFAGHAERCFGSGVCRKRGTGVMCPPAAATGAEEHSTRARANLLRAVASGELVLGDLATDQAREVMETCVACKACKTECPARVDVARAKTWWMDTQRKAGGAKLLDRTIASFRTLARLGSLAPGLANRTLSSSFVSRRLGVAEPRSLPPLARRRLRLPRRGDVLLYPDCFTVYQEPGIGEALVGLLGAAARTVSAPRVGCCGRVMLSEGFVDKAQRTASRSAAALRRTSGPILFCEPSCMSAVTDDWPHLIGDISDIAERCVEAEQHVAGLADGLRFRGGGRVLFHPHCHQRALWGSEGTEEALRLVPDLEVTVPDSGCCGMAGAFGYRAERYDLSVAMAERVLAPAVRATDAEVVATGTSCRHQVADLTGRPAVHPLEFLASRLED